MTQYESLYKMKIDGSEKMKLDWSYIKYDGCLKAHSEIELTLNIIDTYKLI